MKTLALAVMLVLLVLSVNATAAVPTWDTTSFADVDPWELNAVLEVEEFPVVVSSSFNA
jgi:hypothetical protein